MTASTDVSHGVEHGVEHSVEHGVEYGHAEDLQRHAALSVAVPAKDQHPFSLTHFVAGYKFHCPALGFL